MSKLRWIIFLTLTVGFIAALVIFSKSTEIDLSKVDINAIQVAGKDNGSIGDNVFGDKNSKVTLINYGNFQCSACATYYPIVKSVVEKYQDKIRFVFRYRYLPGHPNGKAAQGTAEAAGLQGKFWEMHDLLFESQDSWTNLSGTERTTYFENLAKRLGLDSKKFLADLESDAVNDKIAYDNAIADKAAVDATPMFFLNGTKLEGSVTADAAKFGAAIDAELEKVGTNTQNN